MSQAPFSLPDADTIVGSSHVLTNHVSLNKLLGKRRPKAKVKYLVGIVAVALLLLGSQLTACGNATPSTGSASNTPSLSHTSTSTAGPTRGSTSGTTTKSAAVPTKKPTAATADPRSFTVIEREFDLRSIAGITEPPVKHITLTNSSTLPLKCSVSVTPASAKAWLKLNPLSGNLLGSTTIDLMASTLNAGLVPGSYVAYLVWSPVNQTVDNSVKVTLPVYQSVSYPSVSGISQAGGPAAGGTTVTITGSGFTDAKGVSFGSTAASSFKVVSDTHVTAVSPAGSGTVDVTIKGKWDTSAPVAADQFTYTLRVL
jgi:large repetitive protein